MPGNVQIMRTMNQAVPASAPWGEYTYRARMGIYPDIIYAEDSFTFEKGLFDGNSIPAGIVTNWNLEVWQKENAGAEITPEDYSTVSAFPNPFNPVTEISYTISNASDVSITVFDVAGRQIEQIFNAYQPAGFYNLKFDGSNLASGIYFINLLTNANSQTIKVMLMK